MREMLVKEKTSTQSGLHGYTGKNPYCYLMVNIYSKYTLFYYYKNFFEYLPVYLCSTIQLSVSFRDLTAQVFFFTRVLPVFSTFYPCSFLKVLVNAYRYVKIDAIGYENKSQLEPTCTGIFFLPVQVKHT